MGRMLMFGVEREKEEAGDVSFDAASLVPKKVQ